MTNSNVHQDTIQSLHAIIFYHFWCNYNDIQREYHLTYFAHLALMSTSAYSVTIMVKITIKYKYDIQLYYMTNVKIESFICVIVNKTYLQLEFIIVNNNVTKKLITTHILIQLDLLKCRIAPHLKLLLKNDDTLQTNITAKYKIPSKYFNVLFFIIFYQIFNLIDNSTNLFGIFTNMINQREYKIDSPNLAKQDCFLRKDLINCHNKDINYKEDLFFTLHLINNMLIFGDSYNIWPSVINYSNLDDVYLYFDDDVFEFKHDDVYSDCSMIVGMTEILFCVFVCISI